MSWLKGGLLEGFTEGVTITLLKPIVNFLAGIFGIFRGAFGRGAEEVLQNHAEREKRIGEVRVELWSFIYGELRASNERAYQGLMHAIDRYRGMHRLYMLEEALSDLYRFLQEKREQSERERLFEFLGVLELRSPEEFDRLIACSTPARYLERVQYLLSLVPRDRIAREERRVLRRMVRLRNRIRRFRTDRGHDLGF